MVSIHEQNRILDALVSVNPEKYRNSIENLIAYVCPVSGDKPGQGYLYVDSSNGKLIIEIRAADTLEEKLLTFVHETFHIPLILAGHDMASEGRERYDEIEAKIDAAAIEFCRQHPNLVRELFASYWRLNP